PSSPPPPGPAAAAAPSAAGPRPPGASLPPRHRSTNLERLRAYPSSPPSSSSFSWRTTWPLDALPSTVATLPSGRLMVTAQARIPPSFPSSVPWTVPGTALDVGHGPDVLALDPGLHRLYVASESGNLAVFDAGPQVRKLGAGNAGSNAHSVS